MENRLERSIQALILSGIDAAAGAEVYGEAIVLLQNPAAQIRAESLATRAAEHVYLVARDAVARQREVVVELVAQCRPILTLTRDNLKPRFGNSHGAAWEMTGLARSLVIPRKAELVQSLLTSFRSVLILHPGEEVAAKGITAAHLAAFFAQLDAARAELRDRIVRANDARDARDAKVKILSKRVRDLIKELKMRLGPLDSRWLAFGFNMPGAKLRPEQPENVTAELVAENNSVAMKWPPVPRAEYYRVWAWVEGESEPVPVGSPADPDFTYENLPLTKQVRLAVSAVNSGGESAWSDVVLVQTLGEVTNGKTFPISKSREPLAG